MASEQNTGEDSNGVTPTTGPSERVPQYPLPPNRSKRSWSDEEDALLIEVLLELHHTGRYKADQEFKPGIYAAAEKELERRKPGCGIRADPHIYSRVKTLKSHFSIVQDMLHGNNSSGFGWDPVQMCVTADDDVWASYLQSHKSAAQFKSKTFKYYDEITDLFSIDRAYGSAATSHRPAAMNESHNEDNINPETGSEHMASQSVADIGSPNGSTSTMFAGRKRKASVDAEVLAEIIERTSERIESSIITVGKQMSDAFSNVTLATKRELMLEALLNMPSLS